MGWIVWLYEWLASGFRPRTNRDVLNDTEEDQLQTSIRSNIEEAELEDVTDTTMAKPTFLGDSASQSTVNDSLKDVPACGQRPESIHNRAVRGYESGFEYLRDELERAAYFVKAYVIRNTALAEQCASPREQVTQTHFTGNHP